MKIVKFQVFDPSMCCSNGVCGSNVDQKLTSFAGDLDWLRKQGMLVERFNLASDPAAFAETHVVKDALHTEGPDCLPLILVDGTIVHRGDYPDRQTLAELCGIDPASIRESDDRVTISESAACGPGCGCGKPSGRGWVKSAISAVIMIAAAGVIIYKTSLGKQADTTLNCSMKENSGFTLSELVGNDPLKNQTICRPAPEQAGNTLVVKQAESAAIIADPVVKATRTEKISSAEKSNSPAILKQDQVEAENNPVTLLPEEPHKEPGLSNNASFGENLSSLAELNKVALNQDAVFILVPDKEKAIAGDPMIAAVLSAQKTLGKSDVKVGLFSLSTSSPDYASISPKVKPPAILVACKGKGMGVVSGEVTEAKLLQTFMSASRAGGGCCPAGSKSSGCK